MEKNVQNFKNKKSFEKTAGGKLEKSPGKTISAPCPNCGRIVNSYLSLHEFYCTHCGYSFTI